MGCLHMEDRNRMMPAFGMHWDKERPGSGKDDG